MRLNAGDQIRDDGVGVITNAFIGDGQGIEVRHEAHGKGSLLPHSLTLQEEREALSTHSAFRLAAQAEYKSR